MSKLKNYYTTSVGLDNDYHSDTWMQYNIEDVIIQMVAKHRIMMACIELSYEGCKRIADSSP